MILDSVDFKNEDIVIADPWGIVYFNDWQKYLESRSNNRYGITNDLKKFGFKKVISHKTIFENFKCEFTRIDINGDKIKLGSFFSNTGFIAVFSLDEILKYKPHYDYENEEKDNCAVIIRNFTGRISIERVGSKGITIVGQGNIDFYSEIME